jgi:hypothetical protein
VYRYLQMNLRQFRVLLLLPLLISQMMFCYEANHRHTPGPSLDGNHLRHVSTETKLARMKAVPAALLPLETVPFVREYAPETTTYHCPEPPVRIASHPNVSYPNRASPT